METDVADKRSDCSRLHCDRNEYRRAHLLEEHVGYRLEHGVRNKEDGKGGIVAGRGEAERFP